mgnify:CR=1 FL=1
MFQNICDKGTTYPGTDAPFDHSFLLASLKLKLSLVKKHNKPLKLDTPKLKQQEIKTELKTKINKDPREISNTNKGLTPIESWNNIKEVL